MTGWMIVAYLFFLVVFVIYSLFGLFHLKEYSYVGDASRIVIVLYSIISLSVIVVSFVFLIA